MNKWTGMGRLVRDPEIRYTQGSKPMCIARYALAVNRKYKQQDGQTADFISCIAFGKNGEFAEKYLKQGVKIVVSGRIQTGSYTNKDGVKIHTTDVVIEEQEFAESKNAASANGSAGNGGNAGGSDKSASDSDFMSFDSDSESSLPF